jgi:hypothetical protein
MSQNLEIKANLGVIGLDKVNAALSSLESRFKKFNQQAASASNINKQSSKEISAEKKRHSLKMANLAAELAAANKVVQSAKQHKTLAQSLAAPKIPKQSPGVPMGAGGGGVSGMGAAVIGGLAGVGLGALLNVFSKGADLLSGALSKVFDLGAKGVQDTLQTSLTNTQLANRAIAQGDTRSQDDIKKMLLTAQDSVIDSGVSREQAQAFQSAYFGKGSNIDEAAALTKTLAPIITRYGVDDASNIGDQGAEIANALRSRGMEGQELYNAVAQLVDRSFRGENVGKGFDETNKAAAELSNSAQEYQNMLTVGMGLQKMAVEKGALQDKESGIVMKAFVTNLKSKAKEIKKLGIESIDEDGNLPNLSNTVLDIIQATGGDKGKIEDLLGDQGAKLLGDMPKQFKKMLKEGMTEEQARASLGEQIKKSAEVNSGQDIADLDDAVSNEPLIKFYAVIQNLSTKIGGELAPTVSEFITEFSNAIPEITKVIASFAAGVAEHKDEIIGFVKQLGPPLMSFSEMMIALAPTISVLTSIFMFLTKATMNVFTWFGKLANMSFGGISDLVTGKGVKTASENFSANQADMNKFVYESLFGKGKTEEISTSSVDKKILAEEKQTEVKEVDLGEKSAKKVRDNKADEARMSDAMKNNMQQAAISSKQIADNLDKINNKLRDGKPQGDIN